MGDVTSKKNQQRQIGQTGIWVHAIGLGAMPLSLDSRPEEASAIQVLHAAIDAGIDFIDTADVYCIDHHDLGHNERLIAKALRERNSGAPVYVATKGGCTRPQGRWERDGRPEHLKSACKRSLENLQVEKIFFYQLHAPDPRVPFEASVGALAELKEEGVIEHIGLSNVSAQQLKLAQQITRIESVQNRFNPFEQQSLQGGILDACKSQRVTFISHSPVGGFFSHRERVTHPILVALAAKYKTSPYNLILCWHLSKGDHVFPIPGASRVESVTNAAKAVDLVVDPQDLRKIDCLGE